MCFSLKVSQAVDLARQTRIEADHDYLDGQLNFLKLSHQEMILYYCGSLSGTHDSFL